MHARRCSLMGSVSIVRPRALGYILLRQLSFLSGAWHKLSLEEDTSLSFLLFFYFRLFLVRQGRSAPVSSQYPVDIVERNTVSVSPRNWRMHDDACEKCQSGIWSCVFETRNTERKLDIHITLWCNAIFLTEKRFVSFPFFFSSFVPIT